MVPNTFLGGSILKSVRLTFSDPFIRISEESQVLFGDRLKILSISEMLGEVILRAHEGRSVGEMFDE